MKLNLFHSTLLVECFWRVELAKHVLSKQGPYLLCRTPLHPFCFRLRDDVGVGIKICTFFIWPNVEWLRWGLAADLLCELENTSIFAAHILPGIFYSCISFAFLILRTSPCSLSPEPDDLCSFYPFAFPLAFVVLIPQWVLSCGHL